MAEEDEEEITKDQVGVKSKLLPVSALSTYSCVPPRRTGPKEQSYFYQEGKAGVVSIFDCIFKRPLDYNQNLHRDDREHAKSIGLKVNEEEWARPIGVLTSSLYGRHIYKPVEEMNREHVRVNHLKGEFYRKNTITCMEEPGYGHIAPS
ncbi:cilia- and flagella-associated protein 90 [Sminthopsis crassicaudata]|uniref:cilia- and flagella-associated protein 90 n=1 Tax=Sminthopsis crassicaudata TaxID=9301 RepID=UPI003D69F032